MSGLKRMSHQCISTLDEPIEERRFADIWLSNYSHLKVADCEIVVYSAASRICSLSVQVKHANDHEIRHDYHREKCLVDQG